MTDGPIEFRDPRVSITYHKDNPELVNRIKDVSLASWEAANKELINDAELGNEAQVLTGMISSLVGFLQVAYGADNAAVMLEEMLRRIKTTDDYKKSLQ